MPITNAKAQKTFLAARTALNNISRSQKATLKQKNAARAARTKLTKEFVANNIAEVAARTALFKQFIRDMTAVIRKIKPGPPVQALSKLQGVVATAKTALSDG